MASSAATERQVEASIRMGLGEVALVRERFAAPIDRMGQAQAHHHLQLSLLPMPRPSRAGYPEHWGPARMERMGDVFLLPAQAALHAQSECRQQRSVVCTFAPGSLERWFEAEPCWNDRQLVGSLDIACDEIRRLLTAIARELEQPGFASEALVELMSGQLCIALGRHFHALGLEEPAPAGGLPAWRLRLIDEALTHDPGGATLASLAGLCGLSVRHLARAYRASTGGSLGDTIARRRIALARRMLADGASVKATAFAAGFSAPTNFASAFRRATGWTPRQFRDRSGRR